MKRDKLIAILDKVTQELRDMPQEDFDALLEKNKNGDFAKIIRSINHDYMEPFNLSK